MIKLIIGEYILNDEMFKQDGWYTIVLRKRGKHVDSLRVYDSKLKKQEMKEVFGNNN